MDTTPVRRRTPIAMLFLGVVAGAVAGWFAHQAVVVPTSEPSVSVASPANSAAAPSVEPTKAESSASATERSVQPTKTESRAAPPARTGEIPLSVKDATSTVAAGSSRAKTLATDSPEPPSAAASSHPPVLGDLRDSVSIRCTFGPGNGGRWPNGKLTVGDAAWQGGPVDFQSINYDAGTAQMVGQVTRSPKGEVPVTITTSDSDITFTGRTANGTLTIISMFSNFDNAGHHTAVMSMHDGKHELDIAQFFGSCDPALKSLNSTDQ
jgi:hypothetical protein